MIYQNITERKQSENAVVIKREMAFSGPSCLMIDFSDKDFSDNDFSLLG
jgi:hypothetical protein